MTPSPLLAGTAWAEPLTLAAMLVAFGLFAVWKRWPIGIALVVAAWVGAAANGDLFPARHLVEGAFSYLDPILVIATAMMFMRVLADGGSLAAIGWTVERRFGRRPSLLLPMLMLMVMFPGMITGSSTASVLTTGAMVASILIGLGLSRERAAALVAMGGVLGMVAPPVNIPAMLIGAGIDLPYVGFGFPLAAASFPLALALAYGLGWPILRPSRARVPRAAAVAATSAGRPATMPGFDGLEGAPRAAAPANEESPTPVLGIGLALASPVVAGVLMAAPRVWPAHVRDPGLPLCFVVAMAVAVLVARTPGPPGLAALDVCGAKLRFASSSMLRGVEESLPVLGILTGVGAFIQVMTLTGARGWLVALMVGAPSWAVLAAAAASMPLFGAVSAFGSASVLGVPFLLALLGRNEVVTTAALSLLAALGDLMLPAALAATLAAQVSGVDDRRRVLRLCVIPAVAAVAVALVMLIYSTAIGRALR